MTLSTTELIAQRLGLAAQGQVNSDFQQLLRELARGDMDGFLARLHAQDDHSQAWQALIRALAIGETYFFRDRAHFELLRRHILPPLIQERRSKGELTLSLCSVGCATGEEPYSLAILLREMIPDIDRWLIRLVGMDINTHALAMAREGVYRQWSFRTNDGGILRHFEPVPGGYRIKPELRAMVTFRESNLINMPPLPQYDVIFCRNVLLYFTKERTTYAESLLRELLYPEGWLFLGQAEALRDTRNGWITHLYPGASAYQKTVQSESSASVREYRGVQTVKPPPAPILSTASATTPTPHTRYESAVMARQNDDHDTALKLALAVLAEHPNHARAHTLVACLYADQKRTADAHAHLDAALLREPLMADAYYLRGLLYMESGNPDDLMHAQKAFQRALYCQRNHPLASYLLGTLTARTGDIPRAIRLWQNALTAIQPLTPTSPLSDTSDITAGRLSLLINQQIDGWR